MKKLVSIVLALVMLCSLTVVFATTDNASPSNRTLTAKFTAMTAASDVISVNVVWEDDLELAYSAGAQGTWNPSTHQYDGAVAPSWTDGDVKVTVTNHSNVEITVSTAYENKGMAANWSTGSVDLPSAVGKETDATELTTELTLTASGAIEGDLNEAGIATVTFAKKAA